MLIYSTVGPDLIQMFTSEDTEGSETSVSWILINPITSYLLTFPCNLQTLKLKTFKNCMKLISKPFQRTSGIYCMLTLDGWQVLTKTSLSLPSSVVHERENTTRCLWVETRAGRDHSVIIVTVKTELTLWKVILFIFNKIRI